ncbi:hypothetical protein SAMN05216188_104131 [Lentzea xinjiangensis]|uniref:Uncharacterized protein n=1 Tax=Lentzea xinjiangensis TaxID=402600 RepID=A0A1H9HP60_9PSEU|nr:hypothetical protein [Lentzea xinjiangensis]SEQ64078.1 hypothetical protein SAMN05216188_104131 [Lentzea xinjiangensis]
MRLIRLGAEPSAIGADVRAALTACGAGTGVLGGVALMGVQPPGCPMPLDAIVVLPKGVLVIVGVDLPDPAVKLEAPLGEQWKMDGWPLVAKDGTANPATEAVAAATAVAQRIQAMRAEPLPVSTVVAVGPFVSQVVQPTVDLNRGVRVLHPKPSTLLTAARELATSAVPCTADHAAKLLAILQPTGTPPDARSILTEGFSDAVSPDLASASTMLIPKVDARPVTAGARAPGKRPWAFLAVAGTIALVLLVWLMVLLSGGDDSATGSTSQPAVPQATTVVVDGTAFVPKETRKDTDCQAQAFGDVKAWLIANECGALLRATYETTVRDKQATVLVADLDLLDSPSATALLSVVSLPGSGGVHGPDGKPLENAAFASGAKGSHVQLAFVVWSGGAGDQALDPIAKQALRLPATR